tara:strand:- start:54 stop:1007 length:954 start_codon:yes stop_codon:yes gene_type:complete
MEKISITLDPVDNNRLLSLCGPLNNNIKEIEMRFNVEINQRGSSFYLKGNKKNIDIASKALKKLYLSIENEDITLEQLREFLNDPNLLKINDSRVELEKNSVKFLKFKDYKIKISSKSQEVFVDAIKSNDLVFSVGASGSGKTFLAIAAALHYLDLGIMKKIVLVRPAVEAGENLGFLPGDLSQKIDPYLRPMYDALNTIMETRLLNSMIDHNVIEVAPLAYMRGRTLNNSFIILDEAQNSTKEQMKMFLTRLGKNSKAVITGDITQIDLPNAFSGLVHVIPLIKDIPGIGVCEFSDKDVLRHPLVRKIIKAYETKK